MKQNPKILSINFDRSRQYLRVSVGVYKRGESFYERPKINGRWTWRVLKAVTFKAAKIEAGKNRALQAAADVGLAKSPYQVPGSNLGKLIDFYEASGCPHRNESPREGSVLIEEKKRCDWLRQWWGKRKPHEVTLEDCREYWQWRIKWVKKGVGNRTVDLELATLSAVFRWGMKNPRKTGVTFNPIGMERTRYQKSADVKHCRDFQPSNGDELHNLARYLFQDRQSEALGWLALLQSMIGHRVGAMLALRVDAGVPGVPGYVQERKDETPVLWLYQSKNHKGTFPFIEVHPALGSALSVFRRWHDLRHPESPWFFPMWGNPAETVDTSSLTGALQRAAGAMGLAPRTSHGLRAYHVNVLRSMGLSNAAAAERVGHESGGKLIVQVYGKPLPYKIGWLPETLKPAWEDLDLSPNAKAYSRRKF